MRSALTAAAQRRVGRSRAVSLSVVPPPTSSSDYDSSLAAIAASILYRSPEPSPAGRPVYILNSAALPDANEVDYDELFSYVLARLPEEDELLAGTEYEVVFFAGGAVDGSTVEKRQGPGLGWHLQAYRVLGRATRKKLQRLYIVHPRTWVRVLLGVFGTIVSPKFRRKIVHEATLSGLAEHIPIQRLLIPPSVYLHDRRVEAEILVEGTSTRRAFGARHALPRNIETGRTRLPRVLRETTSFVTLPANLKTEGLFRVPPHAVLQSAVKEAYERGQRYIIWKERGAMYAPPGMDAKLVDEIRIEDAYSVYVAASIIKQWYRELREPIFAESSYTYLARNFGDVEIPIPIERLADLFSSQSSTSPLTAAAREILIRHLFPMLHLIATHEAENKMGGENLAICFAICLICGSNQLEDAKVSSVVKRIICATISVWPQLRASVGISSDAFREDISDPFEARDYEDDTDVSWMDDSTAPDHQDRINMFDMQQDLPFSRDLANSQPQPNTTSVNRPPGVAPNLPLRPARKPTPTSVEALETPPSVQSSKSVPPKIPGQYPSANVWIDEQITASHSPTNLTPTDVSQSGLSSLQSSNNLGKPTGTFPPRISSKPLPPPTVPKRKAVGRSAPSPTTSDIPAETTQFEKSFFDDTTAAIEEVSLAAATAGNSDSTATPHTANSNETNPLANKPSGRPNLDDTVFRKPSWPASAKQHFLTKPVVPDRKIPRIAVQTDAKGEVLAAPTVPKPRAPSPGLLARMGSMEKLKAEQVATPLMRKPKRLDLQRSSVEDLRRLYEERAKTAEGLARMSAARQAPSCS